MKPPSHPVSDLIIRILGTNNGYLFAPSQNEIDIAKKHPSVFIHVCNMNQDIFPNKIMLK